MSESQITARIRSTSPRPDASGEDLFAGLVTDIGVEQADGGDAQRPHFGHPRKGRADGFERGDMLLREAARLSRRKGRDMDFAVREVQR